MSKKVLAPFLVIGLVAAMSGAGLYAYFSDTETSRGNTFTAGVLDLEVDGSSIFVITVENIAPGYDSGYYKWIIKNVGSLPGRLSVTFSEITNDEQGMNEPENIAESSTYENHNRQPTRVGDPLKGELGQYLKPGVHPDEIPEEAKPYVTILSRNDDEGWFIAEVNKEVDIGGTIGWGPKNWSVPSRLESQWQTGPPHPWGTPGLNYFSGATRGTLGYLPNDILNPGQEVAFFFRVKLDNNLAIWNGVKWVEVDDSVIQSDKVIFSITFRLSQV